MAGRDPQPFQPDGTYVARFGFKFGGQAFRAGDVFPWREIGCNERRLRQMYDARYIVPASEQVEAPVTQVLMREEEEVEPPRKKRKKRKKTRKKVSRKKVVRKKRAKNKKLQVEED